MALYPHTHNPHTPEQRQDSRVGTEYSARSEEGSSSNKNKIGLPATDNVALGSKVMVVVGVADPKPPQYPTKSQVIT